MLYRSLICGFVLSGCAATSQTGTRQLSSEQAYDIFAGSYHNAFPDVSRPEAARRMGVMSESRNFYTCIRQQPGFAGLVIEHSPVFEIQSYFKGNAKEKLAACTDDPNFRAIDTTVSLADLQRDKAIAETALRKAGIEPFAVVKPYGHMGNRAKLYGENFITTDGHVLISVPKADVTRADAVVAPLALPTVYVREEVIDLIIPT